MERDVQMNSSFETHKDSGVDGKATGGILSSAAFESAFRKYYTPLYCYAYDIMLDSELARDVVSDVFATVWTLHRDIDAGGLRNYLYVAVRNHSIDEMRRRGKMSEVPLDLAEELGDSDNTWEERERKIARLSSAISKLSKRSQRIIDLRYRKRLSVSEIAVEEDISVDGVKKSLYRSIVMLREMMNAKNLLNIVHVLLLL